MSASFILAQISDTHVMTEPREGGVDHAAQVRKVFAAMQGFKPDAIIVTGDLVNDSRADEYEVLAELLLAAPAPVYVLPGNHDDVALIRQALPEHNYLPRSGALSYAIDEYPVRLVCVDQVVRGETHGLFTEAHASWLDDTLAAAPARPSLVALHHPPFATHDRLFDTIGLRQRERFEAVIGRHPQVQRIICGHHHRGSLGQVAHAPALIAPSTAWAYSLSLRPEQPVAQITNEQGAWVLHVWTEKDGFASHFMGL